MTALLGPASRLVPAGGRLEPPWRTLPELPVLVLVGLTGTGKSTTLGALAASGLEFGLLPNRRVLVDAAIIEPLAGSPVADREARFRLTARYRAMHPGGVAEALTRLAIDPAAFPPTLVFDGLRGRDEVAHAALAFPLARFVALGAPDEVRVRRLLGRGDVFDRAGPGRPGPTLARLEAAGSALGPGALARLAALETEGIPPDEIVAKTRIVAAEREHYDPGAARAVLDGLGHRRALALDTAALAPPEAAARIRAWL